MLEIVYRSVADLRPYERNARTHSKDQVAQIAASIAEFGFTNPILLREDGASIGAGHGRLEAAKLIGLAEVPTIILPGLSDAQWQAYIIADNKLALNAGWDLDTLKLELADLSALDFDMTLTGFGADELADLLFAGDSQLDGDADEAVEPAGTPPVSEIGDVWELGPHRLICGDATSATVVERVLGGVKPHLMVTDPPYGVKYDPGELGRVLDDGAKRATGKVMNDDRADWREAWALFPGSVAYVWHAYKAASVVEESLAAAGLEVRAQIIWRKARATLSPGNINPKTMGYNAQHEAAWYVVRKGHPTGWRADGSQTTVWDIPHLKNDTGHGTQKPLDCMKRPIENNSSPGQAVYDPFMGSGTTILAAHDTGRVAYGCELDPAYVDLIVSRFAKLTKLTPILTDTGETFSEVQARRQPTATPTVKIAPPAKAKRAKKGTP